MTSLGFCRDCEAPRTVITETLDGQTVPLVVVCANDPTHPGGDPSTDLTKIMVMDENEEFHVLEVTRQEEAQLIADTLKNVSIMTRESHPKLFEAKGVTEGEFRVPEIGSRGNDD